MNFTSFARARNWRMAVEDVFVAGCKAERALVGSLPHRQVVMVQHARPSACRAHPGSQKALILLRLEDR
jgi:hypothetical protein